MVNFWVQMYAVPMALSYATVALVGNSIGEGNKRKAHSYARVTGLVMGIISLLLSVIMMVFRFQIAKLFTPDEVVINITAETFLITGGMFFFDGLNCFMKGVI